MSNKAIPTMSPTDIVTEISEIRDTLNASTLRIFELSRALYSHTRRTASEGSAAYITYANGWMRFSGALVQGLKRTSSIDRYLERAQKAEIEQQEQEALLKRELEARKERKAHKTEKRDPLGDLIDVYGEDLVNAASR